jgi:hypothetical protein
VPGASESCVGRNSPAARARMMTRRRHDDEASSRNDRNVSPTEARDGWTRRVDGTELPLFGAAPAGFIKRLFTAKDVSAGHSSTVAFMPDGTLVVLATVQPAQRTASPRAVKAKFYDRSGVVTRTLKAEMNPADFIAGSTLLATASGTLFLLNSREGFLARLTERGLEMMMEGLSHMGSEAVLTRDEELLLFTENGAMYRFSPDGKKVWQNAAATRHERLAAARA